MRKTKKIIILLALFLSFTIFMDDKIVISTEYDKKFNYVADTGCIADFGNMTVSDSYNGTEKGLTSNNDDKWQILNEKNGLITYTWGLPEKTSWGSVKHIEKISYEITDKGGGKCSGDIALSSSSTKAYIEFHVTKPTWKYVQLKVRYSDGDEDKIDGKILIKVASTKEPAKLNSLVIEKSNMVGNPVTFKPSYSYEHSGIYETIKYNIFANDGSQINNQFWNIDASLQSPKFDKQYKLTLLLEPNSDFIKDTGGEARKDVIIIDFSKLKEGENTCVSGGTATDICSIEGTSTGNASDIKNETKEENKEANKEAAAEDNTYHFGNEDSKSKAIACDDNLRDFIRSIWNVVYIFVPIALIVFCTVDFLKAMANNDAEGIKKASSNTLKRIIAGILLLALPLILKILLGWFGIELCI